MPLETIASLAALAQKAASDSARWPSRLEARNRVDPVATPTFRPRFRIAPGAKIFTIGSCFARNVERALVKRGYEIPAWSILEQDAEFAAFGPNVLNNYGVANIYYDLAAALDPGAGIAPEAAFFEVYDGRFVDANLPRKIHPAPLATVQARRRAITRMYQQIASCGVVIITLGLAECWYDTQTKMYLNIIPHRAMLAADKDRYELHVMSYRETLAFLAAAFDLLKPIGCRVLLTVSPVPLMTTFRRQDVMSANTYSKAVLRAAAEEIVSLYDFADYFPSYESVTLSQRDQAWEDDLTHVRRPLIETIVDRMLAGYTRIDAGDGLAARAEAAMGVIRAHLKSDPQAVVDALKDDAEAIGHDPDVAFGYGRAAFEVGDVEACERALSCFAGGCDDVRRDMVGACCHLMRRRYDEAASTFRRFAVAPDVPKDLRQQSWLRLLDTQIRRGGALDDALTILDEWKASMRRVNGGEPFRLIALAFAATGDERAEAYFRYGLDNSLGLDSNRLLADFAVYLAARGRTTEAAALAGKIDSPRRDLADVKARVLQGVAMASDA